MKHRARLEREEREDKEVDELKRSNSDDTARLNIINARLKSIASGQLEDEADADDKEALEGEADELKANISKRNKRMEDISEKRKWNIDNICVVKEEKSIVNTKEAVSLKADDYVPTGETEGAIKES